ncbi:hypothetical protein J3Q64DRAFT_1836485 [Phycomyces blakesleeanus]|uniref:Receptor L-domain domain-containing protein n=2 Tax=Phycomyces blakesleeanus TaxID=4837 RepID=A0ABR3AW61_PHYBL
MTRLSLTAIVLAISAVTLAQAQGPECSGSIKPISQGDLEAIKNCKVFTGSILIDATQEAFLTLNGVEEITGDLIVQSSVDLKSFSAPQLKVVRGELKLQNHTILERADLPALVEAKGLTLAILPGLQIIQFPSGLNKVESVRIEDTRAPAVTGLGPETMDTFILTNNNYMRQFDLSTVKQMTGTLFITSNGQGLDFGATNLATLRSATFRNLAQLNLPVLTTVAADISFHQNEFTKLSLDGLEMIGGTMTLANNDRLTETSFKSLFKIGGALSIGNNTQLKAIDGFSKLSEVDGTIDLAGAFDLYAMPAIQDIRGGMRLQTSSSVFPCSELEKKLKGDNIVKGNTWNCASSLEESQMAPTLGQESSPSAGQAKIGTGSTGNMGSSGSGSAGSSSSSSGSGSNGSSANIAGSDLDQTTSVATQLQGSWLAFAMGIAVTFWF